jgi:hypothetical protein
VGWQLREMIRDGAPATWTKDMVHVAKEIAADARDVELERMRAGEVARSTLPIAGDWVRSGKWRDGLVERCCMSERAVSRVLTELGRAGYEMRVQLGVAKNGEPVYAAKGHAVTFAVRYLAPRPQLQSPPNSATFEQQSTSDSATFDGQSPPISVPKPAEFGDPLSVVSGDDDVRAAAAAAVAERYSWPLDHARRVAETVIARAKVPPDWPKRYVLTAIERSGPASWAPDAARWKRDRPSGSRHKATTPRPPWCGQCRESTRRLEDEDGYDAGPCPNCHPTGRRSS